MDSPRIISGARFAFKRRAAPRPGARSRSIVAENHEGSAISLWVLLKIDAQKQQAATNAHVWANLF
jgi:hypothetical protein